MGGFLPCHLHHLVFALESAQARLLRRHLKQMEAIFWWMIVTSTNLCELVSGLQYG